MQDLHRWKQKPISPTKGVRPCRKSIVVSKCQGIRALFKLFLGRSLSFNDYLDVDIFKAKICLYLTIDEI